MNKRIISVIVCIIVLGLVCVMPVFAGTKIDTKIADVKLYADEQVLINKEFTVTIYIENISSGKAVLANDLPLSYDQDKLKIVSVDPIYPKEWRGLGEYLGHEKFDEYPYYLRSLPDASDIFDNKSYRISESKQIGYKVNFMALKLGNAFVSVEDDASGKNNIMLVVVEGEEVNNYGANGMRVDIEVCNSLPGNSSFPDGSSSIIDNDSSVESKDISYESSQQGGQSSEVSGANDESSVSEILSSGDESSVGIESKEASDDNFLSESSDGQSGDSNTNSALSLLLWIGLFAIIALLVALVVFVVVKKKKV